MRNPSTYTRSLLICQSFITGIYIVVGTVLCYYCGSYIASPALGSAGPLLKRIAYGIALPGLVASTVIVLHVSGTRVLDDMANFKHFFNSSSSQINTCSCAYYEALNISQPIHSNIG